METFIVRVWRPNQAPAIVDDGIRGVVEHVQSGSRRTFADEAGLVAAIRDLRGAPPPEAVLEGA